MESVHVGTSNQSVPDMAITEKIEQHKVLWHDSVRSFRGHDVCMYYIVLYHKPLLSHL